MLFCEKPGLVYNLSMLSLRGMLLFASERVNYLHGIASTRVGHALLTFDMARDAVLFH
jgi:hypothetical protein